VRSAFEETAAAVETGLSFTGVDRLTLSFDATRAEDVRYPGAGMDAPMDDSDGYRLRYDAPAMGGELRLESWYGKVHHLMDNFSVRTLTAPMAMAVPARSQTFGGRAVLSRPMGPDWEVSLAVDYLDNRRHATRWQGPTPDELGTVNSYLWPGADLTDLGLALQGARALAGGSLTAGLRYDHVEAGAGKADHDPASPMLPSPNELYRTYYGRGAGDENEDHISALLRYERPVAHSGLRLFAGVSRTLRTADATERYLAMNHPTNPAMRWVGNPGLDPEVHRQVDLGFSWRLSDLAITGAAFLDDVEDYITPDRARSQPGILESDGARIYRNVDARIYGAELEGRWRFTERWTLAASAAWVRADNTEDDRPLPQIPPLNGVVEVTREAVRWDLGARLRWADRQSRADDDPTTGSGVDARETPGHGVVDLFVRAPVGRLGELGVGVDNLFDKTWADHLNRANQDPFNPDPVQVNEPGRTLWANWRQSF
jgi:iron complex outermembrane receptor protein